MRGSPQVSACGFGTYVGGVTPAGSDRLDAGGRREAEEKYAPVWWTRAIEYLHEAREGRRPRRLVQGSAFGRLATEAATQALRSADRRQGPVEAADSTVPGPSRRPATPKPPERDARPERRREAGRAPEDKARSRTERPSDETALAVQAQRKPDRPRRRPCRPSRRRRGSRRPRNRGPRRVNSVGGGGVGGRPRSPRRPRCPALEERRATTSGFRLRERG